MPPLRITPSARVSVVGSSPGPDVHGHHPLYRSHSAGRELTRTLVTAEGRGCLMRGRGLGAGGRGLSPQGPRAVPVPPEPAGLGRARDLKHFLRPNLQM